LFDVLTKDIKEYEQYAPEIIEWDAYNTENADLLIIAHGVVFRSVASAVKEMADNGMRVGYFRPITLRPFPKEQLREAALQAKKVLVVESAYGQLFKMVEDNIYGLNVPIETLFKPGVGITPEEVAEKAKSLLAGKEA